jgi:hypothetical protein
MFPLAYIATSTLQHRLRPCCDTNIDVRMRVSRPETVNQNFGDSINMANCMKLGTIQVKCVQCSKAYGPEAMKKQSALESHTRFRGPRERERY